MSLFGSIMSKIFNRKPAATAQAAPAATAAAAPAAAAAPVAPVDVEAVLTELAAQKGGGALRAFGRRLGGYLTEEAVLVGVESRTSSPVRVPRHPETLESPEIGALYPVGEGAGYAGGIMSAAMDGVRIADRIAAITGAA